MKKYKLYCSIVLFILMYSSILAQNELRGKVKENSRDSTLLAGVTVYIPDLKLGAITSTNT